MSTTIAPDPYAGDYTERVQSFFPECKENILDKKIKIFFKKLISITGDYHHKTRLLLQCPEDPNIDIHFYNIRY